MLASIRSESFEGWSKEGGADIGDSAQHFALKTKVSMPPEQAQAWLDGISSLKSRGQANRRGLPGSRSDRAIECSIDLGEGKEMIDSSQLECLRSKSAQVCRFVDSEVKRNLTDFARAAVTATKEEMTSYEWWQPWISLEETHRRVQEWQTLTHLHRPNDQDTGTTTEASRTLLRWCCYVERGAASLSLGQTVR